MARIPPLVLETHTNSTGSGLEACKESVDAFNKRFVSITSTSSDTTSSDTPGPAAVIPASPSTQNRTGCAPTFGADGTGPIDAVQEYTFPADRVLPLPQLESDHEQHVCM